MKVAALLLIFANCECLDVKFKFVKDFITKKNVFLNIYTCEKDDSIKSFLIKESSNQLSNFNGIKFYRNDINNDNLNYLRSRLYFVTDFHSCGINSLLLKQFDLNNLFRYPLKHVFIIKNEDADDFYSDLCQYNILVMSEVYVAFYDEDNIDIYEVYKTGPKVNCVINNYGNWSLSIGLMGKNTSIFTRRKDFKKYELLVLHTVQNNDSLKADFDDI
ncbi:Ionotropic receptor 75e, partial [Diabrotica virgifera virgifera]